MRKIYLLTLLLFTFSISQLIGQPTANVAFTETPPTIDGSLDDWTDVPAIPVDNLDAAGSQDNTAFMKIVWDADYFYIIAAITDEVLHVEPLVHSGYEGDMIYFSIGTKNNRNTEGWYTHADEGEKYGCVFYYAENDTDPKPKDGADMAIDVETEGVEYKCVTYDDVAGTGKLGYIYEIKIPWIVFGLSTAPGNGKKMLFELQNFDYDGEGSTQANLRWGNSVNTWNNLDDAGEITFVKPQGDDATLSSITVTDGTLPAFDAETTDYVVNLDYGTEAIPTVTAVATDPAAKVEIIQATSLDGEAKIIVTSKDESANKEYKVTFNILPSGIFNNSEVICQLYPNPSNGVVTISSPSKFNTIDVYSIAGSKLMTIENENSNKISVDINYFENGIYFFHITTEQGDVSVAKVIKQ